MGVYSMNKGSNENTVELENAGIIDCQYEAGVVGAYAIVAESEENFNSILRAVGVEELAVYESTGVEMVYEAGQVSGFIEAAKKFFMNIWEKIKGLFKKFFAMLSSLVQTDKEFINKYRTHLLKIDMKGFKFKGFKFTELGYSVDAGHTKAVAVFVGKGLKTSGVPDSEAEVQKVLTTAEDKTAIMEDMRSAFIGKSGGFTGAEFSKELFKLFRNGEDTKDDLEGINISDQLTHISANSALKKDAEKAYKDLEKIIKASLKVLSDQEKSLTKAIGGKSGNTNQGAQIRYTSAVVTFVKDAANIAQLVNGAKLTAIKDQNRQAKSICVSAMNYGPKKEETSFTEGSFLSGVVLR